MKKLLHFLLIVFCWPTLSHSQFACSGLDRVDIYLNNKLIATATPEDAPTLKLENRAQPDTLVFHAFTNWEGLRNSTLDVKDDLGELISHINSNNNTGYEAVFAYVFSRQTVDQPGIKSFDVFINLMCERDVEPEQIITFNLDTK